MIEKTDRESAQKGLTSFFGLKRKGNPFVKTEDLRKNMVEYGFSPEDVGTTEEELKTFFVQDCRWQIESDLENWRLTNSIGYPERCFAEGVIEALEKGELRPEDFGIAPEELQDIRKTAGLA
jgi:hypothetical protein